MEFIKLRSLEEYRNYQKQYRNERIQLQERILKEIEENKIDFILGYCNVCEKATKFRLHTKKKWIMNLRELLICENCVLNSRKRCMLTLLKKLAKNSDSSLAVFMYEQISHVFKIAEKITNISLTGSEFLGYDKKPGEIIENIRNEDAMNLSFQENSFNVIISNDVFEHVPDINKALCEAYRVLKNSGTLLISIPFYRGNEKTQRSAVLEKGKIKHLKPPTYHVNPMAEKESSLVFYEFGWDFLNFLKTAGFKDVYVLGYYDIFYGHLGDDLQFIFIGKK